MYDPNEDGVTHINAYSKSKVEVGRAISNFAKTPINTIDGFFTSIESYWYWLLTDPNVEGRDKLRFLHGFQAKSYGRKLANSDWPSHTDQTFRNKIKDALRIKHASHPRLQRLLAETQRLPIVHYYYYGNPPKVVVPKSGQWIWDEWEALRAGAAEAA